MFLLDSLMISGLRWVLDTVSTAADAEMNDDSVLRERLLEAEMRREAGEITDEEFADIETDLLARIREIKARREGTGPLAFGAQPLAGAEDGSRFQVEATVSGEFYGTDDAAPPPDAPRAAEPQTPKTSRTSRTSRTTRTSRTSRTPRTSRTSRTSRTPRTPRTPRT